MKKEKSLGPALEKLQSYILGRWLISYTDGSSNREEIVGWVGGWGVWMPQVKVSVSSANPPNARQTNTAQLLAVLWVPIHFGEGKIPVATDSSFVAPGVRGAARKWRENGWVGKNGPLSNTVAR